MTDVLSSHDSTQSDAFNAMPTAAVMRQTVTAGGVRSQTETVTVRGTKPKKVSESVRSPCDEVSISDGCGSISVNADKIGWVWSAPSDTV